jgi:F-type H+-transporting ATPase subunit delta
MAGEEAAKRYAQAAFAIAVEAGTISQWRADLDDVAAVLAESAATPVLSDDKLPLQQRLQIVEQLLQVSPLALNLAKLLVSKGRVTAARGVAQAFEAMADDHEGIAKAQVTTAVELAPQQRAAIEEKLSASLGKRVQATTSVEPGLLGGIVLRIGDQLVDGSIRTRLRRLKRQLEARA